MFNRSSRIQKYNQRMRRKRNNVGRFDGLEPRTMMHADTVAHDHPAEVAAADAQVPAVQNPAPAVSYPSSTVEGQGDWEHPTIGNWHLHIAAPLPIGEAVKGTIQIPVRLVIHHHTQLRIDRVFINDNSGTKFHEISFGANNQPAFTSDGDTRTYAFVLNMDSRKVSDGWKNFSLRADVTDLTEKNSGRNQFNIQTEWVSYIDNGKKDAKPNVNEWMRSFGSSPDQYKRGVRISAWSEIENYQRIWAIVPKTLSGVQAIDYFHGSSDIKGGAYHEAYVSKGHAIPARGGWKDQPASTGIQTERSARDEKITRVRIDTALLADGWHAPQFFQHTNKISDVRMVFWAQKS